MLRRLAGAAAAPLRRSLCTAAAASSPPLRPPWAMLYAKPALDASGAPSRASLDLHEDLWAQLSVPARLVVPDAGDAADFFAGAVRAATPDGLLLLDFSDTRCRAPVDRTFRPSWLAEFDAAAEYAGEPDVARFVCNPLSGQLLRLPAPGAEFARSSTAGCSTGFGLLTQSEGSRGPPDRYVVAQLSRSRRGGADHPVVRRFLSETGEWDERRLAGPSVPASRDMRIDPNLEVVAFGDRLWWLDPTWAVCSVDPFSDQPEHRLVELPPASVLPDLIDLAGTPVLGRYRRLGVSEGKLRYVEVSNSRKPFVCSSFSLDEKGCCWTLEHKVAFNPVLPERCKVLEDHIPCIAAIDPFRANFLYLIYGHFLIVVDMAKGKSLGGQHLPERAGDQTLCPSGFLVPCMLPTWLESSYIPCAGTLSSKKTNSKRNSLAETLVRADRGQKN
ncbi:hypothetical protein CFC21_003019 [Triticum aestivum]|uniref:DUF1618 domain-containing protein n=2 Tax=Triticum TaxID=4564 RepID=A0A3B5Y3X0_WHEAT|nr:uncharacterized protein LOC123155755 [Triticum aestivum]KAF6985122.1 hypothetical protein CFC21_003019 [Triticum aestivum]